MFVSLGLLLAAIVLTDVLIDDCQPLLSVPSPTDVFTVHKMSTPVQAEDSGAPQLTVPQAIANLKQTEDKGDRYYAAWWLGRFQVRDPEAIEALLAALTDERDRDNPGDNIEYQVRTGKPLTLNIRAQ